MKSRHPHRSAGPFSVGAPSLGAVIVADGDANVSLGVIGLVLAIILLLIVALAVIAVEVAGEHRANLIGRRRFHG